MRSFQLESAARRGYLRPAMTYWLAWLVLAALLLPGAGLLYQTLGERRDRRRFPPPGRMVDAGGHRLHLLRRGEGTPTVVFDSAMASTCLSWSLVQPEVARVTRTVSYDRAGTGWSEEGPAPRDAEQHVRELRQALESGGAEPPYLLVGHSYGGLTMRLFAHRYPAQTAGLLLLDPAEPAQWVDPKGLDRRKIEGGSRLARRGVWVAQLGLARLVIRLGSSGAMRVARPLGSWLGGRVPRPAQDRMLAPLGRVPAQARQAMQWFWSRPRFYRSLAAQIEHVPHSARAVAAAPSDGSLPLTVISAPNEDPGWLPAQRRLAETSRRGRHLLAEGSSHWIPLDRPELVVRLILEMVEEVRLQNGPPR